MTPQESVQGYQQVLENGQSMPPQSAAGQPEQQNGREQRWMPPTQPQPENRGRFSQAPEPRSDRDGHK